MADKVPARVGTRAAMLVTVWDCKRIRTEEVEYEVFHDNPIAHNVFAADDVRKRGGTVDDI